MYQKQLPSLGVYSGGILELFNSEDHDQSTDMDATDTYDIAPQLFGLNSTVQSTDQCHEMRGVRCSSEQELTLLKTEMRRKPYQTSLPLYEDPFWRLEGSYSTPTITHDNHEGNTSAFSFASKNSGVDHDQAPCMWDSYEVLNEGEDPPQQRRIDRSNIVTSNASPRIIKRDPGLSDMHEGSKKEKRVVVTKGSGDLLDECGPASSSEEHRGPKHLIQNPWGLSSSTHKVTTSWQTSEAKLKTPVSASEHVREEEVLYEKGKGRSPMDSTVVSKNLASERKRRKRLNDGLYCLRGLVPKISKMDKASIIGDAIDYIRELNKEVKDMETEIAEMETSEGGSSHAGGYVEVKFASKMCSHVSQGNSKAGESAITSYPKISKRIMQNEFGSLASTQALGKLTETIPDVVLQKLNGHKYHLRATYQNRPGVLLQLVQALELLGLDVLHANHVSTQNIIVNSILVETKGQKMETGDIREAFLKVAAHYQLHQVQQLHDSGSEKEGGGT